jgi:hypothetical protein
MSSSTELRGKERWILLRTIELLARKIVAKEGDPAEVGWDVTAAIAFSQATVEYDEPRPTSGAKKL